MDSKNAAVRLKVVHLTGTAFSEGIEQHRIEDVVVRIYSIAKTVADCFKFRKQIGTQVAVQALRDAWRSRKVTVDELWHPSRLFPLQGGELTETPRATFERRSSPLPGSIPLGLSDEFTSDPTKRLLWRAFWAKAVRRDPMPALSEAMTAVAQFLLPFISATCLGSVSAFGVFRGRAECRRINTTNGCQSRFP